MQKGTIYQLLQRSQKGEEVCYIGSTTYDPPRKRYNHHIDKTYGSYKRYPELFANGDPEWVILYQGVFEDKIQLRKKEEEYLHMYKCSPDLRGVNRYGAYMSDDKLKEYQKKAKKKYENTWKGKQQRKWGAYRTNMRRKLLREIHEKCPVIDGDACHSTLL